MVIENSAPVSYREALTQALHDEMARDPRVVLLGEDIGANLGGAHQVTQGLYDTFGPDRVLDMPLSASAIVGAAAGMALMGLRPVVELQSLDLAPEAFTQITQTIAKLCWRTAGEMYAPLVIRGPAGGGTHGGPWNSASPEAWFAHTPGLKVVMPSTPYDAKGLLKAAIRDNNPVLFLEHRYLYRRSREELPTEDYTVPIGQAEIRRNGTHVTVITYGAMVYHALDAAEQLAGDGIDAEVIDLRTLTPLDRATIADSARQTSKAIIVHEASKTGGLGAEIAAGIVEDCFVALDGPVLRVAAPDVPYPAALELEDAYLPSVAQIIAAAKQLAAY